MTPLTSGGGITVWIESAAFPAKAMLLWEFAAADDREPRFANNTSSVCVAEVSAELFINSAVVRRPSAEHSCCKSNLQKYVIFKLALQISHTVTEALHSCEADRKPKLRVKWVQLIHVLNG
jgi:hypothetical protein